jgi:hypothetical protein
MLVIISAGHRRFMEHGASLGMIQRSSPSGILLTAAGTLLAWPWGPLYLAQQHFGLIQLQGVDGSS